jgi:hypothetical protein
VEAFDVIEDVRSCISQGQVALTVDALSHGFDHHVPILDA